MAGKFRFNIDIYRGRTEDYIFKLYDSGGSELVLDANDVVRFKLSATEGGTPLLDLDSVAPTANGSSITITTLGETGVAPAQARIRFAQADTASLSSGSAVTEAYGELCIVDDSETNPENAIKIAGAGPVIIKPTMGGDIGIT